MRTTSGENAMSDRDDPNLVHLVDMIKNSLRRRIVEGQRATAGEYLARFPYLRCCEPLVMDLIYEEYCLREENGERVVVDQFCDQYPAVRDKVFRQLRYHNLLGNWMHK
jgi:eukaryotic-like serine/threonine-protein kinase